MSTEEDLPDHEELERLVMKRKTGDYPEQMSAAEIEEMLKGLDGIIFPDDDMPAPARDRSEILAHLERASALAKDVGDPIVTWLIQNTLARLRE